MLIVGGRVDKGNTICYIGLFGQFHSPTFTAHHVHYWLLSWNFSAREANLGRDNDARIRSLRIEMISACAVKDNLEKFEKNCTKTLIQWNQNTFFTEDTWFPNASAVTWSLYCKRETSLTKLKNFLKCDDFSGEINQFTDMYIVHLHVYKLPK
jgi:hypothetical protein